MTNLEWLKTLSAEELADWFYDEWLHHLQYRWSSSRGGLIIWLKDRKTEPQTEMTTEQIVNELLSIKKILDDGKMPKQRCDNCKHLTYRWNKTWCDIKCDNPHDMVCDKWERSEW